MECCNKMKLDLRYRESNYFNSDDYFVCDNGLRGLLVTKLERSNGFWWTVESLRFKATTVPIQNTNELLGKRVNYKGIDYFGKVSAFLPPVGTELRGSFGIVWDGGRQVRETGLIHFWQNTQNLDFNYNF